MNLQPGQILADKYRILRLLGQGGMGAVFEGENVRIHRRVAIKVLHPAVASRADVLQRFEREAQAAGRIGSKHIVEVLDLGDLPDGSRYMVMEYLEGQSLADTIKGRGRIPPRDLVPLLVQLLDGLDAAHKAGIIHRDLKPANVHVVPPKAGNGEFVKIVDFGVSKFSVLNSEEMSMTRTGAVVGTPYYMSPEQARGARNADARADLYSVGVILYEAITGQVPFNAETFNELIFKIALESPPPPEQFVPNLDPAFGVIMRKAMARDPNERFQTAEEMRVVLAAWAQNYDARMAHAQAQAQPGGTSARTQVLPMLAAPPPGPWSGPGVAAGPVPGSVAQPFGAEPPPQVPTRSNAGLFAALAAAVLVLGLGGWFLATRSGHAGSKADGSTAVTGADAQSTSAATAPPSGPSAEPTAGATAGSTAEPVASASGAASSEPSPSTVATVGPAATTVGPVAVARPGGGGTARTTTTAAPTSPPTAKPPASGKGRQIGTDL